MGLLCLTAGALTVTLTLSNFTLAWTHSIEKIRWEEDWHLAGHRLELTRARIRGSGAGMEPPAGAVMKEGVWAYAPHLAPLERLRLANSAFTADYDLCFDNRCRPLASFLPHAHNQPVELAVCAARKKERRHER